MEWEKRRKNQFSSFGWSSSSFYLLLKFWCGFLLMYHESAILKYLVYNIHTIDTEKHNLNNIKLLNGTDAKNIHSNSMIISCLFSLNICITNITLFIQIAKRFDSLNVKIPPTNDHFKRHSITYEWPLNYEWPFQTS